jgi:hypothetical protein
VAIRRRAGAGAGRRHRHRKPRERILAAAAAILGLSAAAYFYFHRAPRLTDKDTIVLADFLNNTGDPVFEGTLRQGLAIQLGQSPFLKALPLLGAVLFALLSGGGARLCARGRHGKGQKGVPRLLRIMEGRRPRPPDSSASQSRIRHAAVSDRGLPPPGRSSYVISAD